jgi:helicase-like protein
LVIQDELHLISGPLGTMVGLYEAALDRLCWRNTDGKRVRPKIIVSTATVRKAERQVRALFDRRDTRIFPPPGPDRRDSFFARTLSAADTGARQYLGIAVPGGSPKVLFLRTVISLMAIAETAWQQNKPDEKNPADPYMTLLAYFNALRELGGARRIVEGEVGPRLLVYDRRVRIGEMAGFRSREIKYDVMELTSRVPTDAVADAKRRLGSAFKGRRDKDSVDVALATNMISVGLDITRLGLMVVSGQPKTAAEYIQATSRVGRLADKPGLVVVLLNINKPRDRSHYERFVAWHSAFYRSVEATSVTPYSPRALDRALAAVAVGLGRLGIPDFTPSKGARLALQKRSELDIVVEALATRAGAHDGTLSAAEQTSLSNRVRQRVADVLDDWARISNEVGQAGVELGYQKEPGVAQYLLREMLDNEPLPPYKKRFRAPRSLRDVEPSVLIKLESPSGQPVAE